MTALEDPLSLLEELKQRFGVEESAPPYGPSVIVPNSEYKPEWTQLLNRAGVKIFLGDRYGRVAWIIPLRPRHGSSESTPGLLINKFGDDSEPPGSNPDASTSRGCITGRLWTEADDNLLLEMIHQGKAAAEIARDLTGKMDRTEEAIKGRVRKLKLKSRVEPESAGIHEKPVDVTSVTEGLPGSEPGKEDLRSLLESALLLAEDPKHNPALKLILEACLRRVSAVSDC